jgi:hypothetical protein
MTTTEPTWRLLLRRNRDEAELARAERTLTCSWCTVQWGMAGNMVSDWTTEYEVAHNADQTVWMLRASRYVPDEEAMAEDEDYEVRSEAPSESAVVAALRVEDGTSAEDAIKELVRAFERSGDDLAADETTDLRDFESVPLPLPPKKKRAKGKKSPAKKKVTTTKSGSRRAPARKR